jgi:hypothetical protein
MDTVSNMPMAYCDWDLKARSVFRIGETARARLRSEGAFRVGGTVATETKEQVPLRALKNLN